MISNLWIRFLGWRRRFSWLLSVCPRNFPETCVENFFDDSDGFTIRSDVDDFPREMVLYCNGGSL